MARLTHIFKRAGFGRSENEPTLYVKRQGNFDFLVICLYVDDMIYMGSYESLIEEFKSCVMGKFDMSYLDLLHYFLDLRLTSVLMEFFSHKRSTLY